MKALKYSLFIFLIAMTVSCTKFLDVDPEESISDNQTIFDKTSAEQAVRGIYSSLASGDYYGTGFQSIGYLSGDNIVWTGSQSQIQEFINHDVKAENSTISGAWAAIYRTINRANHVIDKVPGVTDALLTTALKNQLIGEAHFIRALSYFDLARTWGGVPLITTPTYTSSDNSGIARSTLAETYGLVLSDLEKAETLLPATIDRYRATKNTVYALKARYYLYQGIWAKAEEFATRVIIDDANYKLLKPYSTFFANNARGTLESVFEIFYNGTTETNGHRNQWQPQTNGGTRQWAPNDVFVGLVNDPLIGGNRSTLVAKDNQNRWYGNLYYRNPASDPSFVIRVGELYLIRAEARANLDNLPGAVADLDAVRDRAGLTGTTAATKPDILLAIENERRIEFALEPHRWFDLVRTGRAQAVLNITDARKLVLPLPAQQILLDDALEQNDSY